MEICLMIKATLLLFSLTNIITGHNLEVSKNHNEKDENAAEELLKLSFVSALRKSDNSWIKRRRKMEYDLHKKDEFTDGSEIPDPRHFYDITIPNDEFRLHDSTSQHEDESHHQHEPHIEEHEEHHTTMEEASLPGDPHPAVQAAHDMETDANSLIASANNLKMQSVALQSKAAELEKQADILHSNAGGPVVHSQDTKLTPQDTTDDTVHAKETVHDSHTPTEEHTKCCDKGSGPERGGSSARPVVNGQVTGNGDEKAPEAPPLGPPTYEHESHIQQINLGYPMFNLPPKTGDQIIPDFLKPPPPLVGNNPYEVLTSSSLNGTAFKSHPGGNDHDVMHHHHPMFSQKYVISLQGVKPEKLIQLPVVHSHGNVESSKRNINTIRGTTKTLKLPLQKKQKKRRIKKLTKKYKQKLRKNFSKTVSQRKSKS